MQVGVGRLYTVTFTNTSISAQQEFFYIKPAADKVCEIEACYLSNVGVAADAGDAQEELYDVEILRLGATVTAGSGGGLGSTATIAVNDTAGSFSARVNDTTKASGGSTQVLHADGLNVRIPYVWLPPPEHRFPVANSQAIVVRLNSTPSDAVTFNGTLYVRELP